jgi:tellurite methyltransferase
MADRPAGWLVENVDLIPGGSRVLDVASGRGRNALYLATAGWPVHAVDRSQEALDTLRETAAALGAPITVECLDLESGSPALGAGQYGAVIVFNYLHRPLMPAIVAAVAPGGVLIYETFTIAQASRGRPTSPAFLLQDGELPTLVAPLVTVRSREGEHEGKFVSSIAARRM